MILTAIAVSLMARGLEGIPGVLARIDEVDSIIFAGQRLTYRGTEKVFVHGIEQPIRNACVKFTIECENPFPRNDSVAVRVTDRIGRTFQGGYLKIGEHLTWKLQNSGDEDYFLLIGGMSYAMIRKRFRPPREHEGEVELGTLWIRNITSG